MFYEWVANAYLVMYFELILYKNCLYNFQIKKSAETI